MTNEQLERANYLKEKIKELENFLWHAEQLAWTGKIIKRETKYIFRANAYGAFKDEDYFLSTQIKDRLLIVLKEHLKEMKEELENM